MSGIHQHYSEEIRIKSNDINFVRAILVLLNVGCAWTNLNQTNFDLVSFLVTLSKFHKVGLFLFFLLHFSTRGVLCEKVFLELSQNSQENACARVSFLIKLQASGSGISVFLNTFFTEHLWTNVFKAILMLKTSEMSK